MGFAQQLFEAVQIQLPIAGVFAGPAHQVLEGRRQSAVVVFAQTPRQLLGSLLGFALLSRLETLPDPLPTRSGKLHPPCFPALIQCHCGYFVTALGGLQATIVAQRA